jgi:myo-inositol catabolism protein IolS
MVRLVVTWPDSTAGQHRRTAPPDSTAGTLRGSMMRLDNFGLGCWSFALAQKGSDEESGATEVIKTAYEHGVRHFDTAQGYGDGRSEEIVGAALAGCSDAEIATKCRLLAGHETRRAVETSLRRLGRDSVDCFYIHWPRTGMDSRPMLEALEAERERGTIQRVGVSNFTAEELTQGLKIARIDVHQIGYSLLWRHPESEVIPCSRRLGVQLYSYSSLAQGLLTGKMPERSMFAPDDPRPGTVFYDEDVWPHVYRALARMSAIADGAGVSLHHLALRWLIERGGVTRVLVGARSIRQLLDNLAAFSGECDPAVLDALESVSADLRPHVPDIGNIFKYYPRADA